VEGEKQSIQVVSMVPQMVSWNKWKYCSSSRVWSSITFTSKYWSSMAAPIFYTPIFSPTHAVPPKRSSKSHSYHP
jgi:hypothetical protein